WHWLGQCRESRFRKLKRLPRSRTIKAKDGNSAYFRRSSPRRTAAHGGWEGDEVQKPSKLAEPGATARGPWATMAHSWSPPATDPVRQIGTPGSYPRSRSETESCHRPDATWRRRLSRAMNPAARASRGRRA